MTFESESSIWCIFVFKLISEVELKSVAVIIPEVLISILELTLLAVFAVVAVPVKFPVKLEAVIIPEVLISILELTLLAVFAVVAVVAVVAVPVMEIS